MSDDDRERNNRRQIAAGKVAQAMRELLWEIPGTQMLTIKDADYIARFAQDRAYQAIREAEGIDL